MLFMAYLLCYLLILKIILLTVRAQKLIKYKAN